MLKLVPPGTRKGNRFWVVRGRQDGHQIEKSTKTADRERAESFLVQYRRKQPWIAPQSKQPRGCN